MRKAEKPATRLAVGLMSGTSMDGIDAALVRISGPPEKPRVRLQTFLTIPYSAWLQKRLLAIAGGDRTTAAELSSLNMLLGELFGFAAARVCHESRVWPSRLFVVGSHGQTVFHLGGTGGGKKSEGSRGIEFWLQSESEGALGDDTVQRAPQQTKPSTLQLGDPAVIAETVPAVVVADFRVADMAAGGQGAPLVPMVDYLLLRDEHEGRVALNIGGIANVTAIPARAKPEDVFGFDTGPGNMVMDALVRHFTRSREDFDVDGRLASRGELRDLILADALGHPFFSRQPPKSAGREQFGAAFLAKYFFERRRAEFKDLLRTAAELTARSISEALERFVFPQVYIRRLIVSGGGARNKFLMKRLHELLPSLKVVTSDRYGLPIDAKEAMAFAVLADRTIHGLPGNLPRVTGARRPVVLGKIARP
jgi:anhydro-N-acetylmuramic acid kinase